MRILITSGLSASDIGGPFQYAPNLKREFEALGNSVDMVSYSKLEKVLPIGLRHIIFLVRIAPKFINSDYVLALDTYSTGVPVVFLGTIFRKKIIARVGGDFLWSAFVNRTSLPVTLPNFYQQIPELNLKEKIIFFFTKFFVNNVDFLAFNTEWQKNIWKSAYVIRDNKIGVVRNFIPERMEAGVVEGKKFVWVGRVIPEKNLDLVKRVSDRIKSKYSDFELQIVTNKSHQEVLESIRKSYAAIADAITDICPNFVLEVISFNKPFIMTKETGLNEIYAKGGIFIDPVSEKELEDAIEQVLDPEVYNRLVNELKDIQPIHSWQNIAEEYINIWQKI